MLDIRSQTTVAVRRRPPHVMCNPGGLQVKKKSFRFSMCTRATRFSAASLYTHQKKRCTSEEGKRLVAEIREVIVLPSLLLLSDHKWQYSNQLDCVWWPHWGHRNMLYLYSTVDITEPLLLHSKMLVILGLNDK